MAATARGRDEPIAQDAELMAQVTAIARTLSSELSALPLEAVALRARAAVHVAAMGVIVAQCLSWLADERRDEMAGGVMDLLRSMRVLGRGKNSGVEAAILPPARDALRREAETYRQRVVDGIWAEAEVLPFCHARR